jgi:ribonuclease Z
MTFEVIILGSSSATPIYQRHPSAQVLNIHERFFLIDCGEGTQVQLQNYRIKYHRINHIFISHLHGDHYLGLMGLLSTLHLQGRTAPLYIYGPPALQEIMDLQFFHSKTELRYELFYQALSIEKNQKIFEDDEITISTIVLNHRIPCTGFLFKEKPHPRKLKKEEIYKYQIPYTVLQDLKKGKDYVTNEGVIILNSVLTEEGSPVLSYAYCSDTLFDNNVLNAVRGVDVLYHEATFMHNMLERAVETFHTTSLQAAQLAKQAGVKKLLIGHFSARYRDLEPLLREARTEFPETYLALEGERFDVG